MQINRYTPVSTGCPSAGISLSFSSLPFAEMEDHRTARKCFPCHCRHDCPTPVGDWRIQEDLPNIHNFGRLMNAGHVGLTDLYEVSCPELDAMARIAQSLGGCYGARLTGAGFGVVPPIWLHLNKQNNLLKILQETTNLQQDFVQRAIWRMHPRGPNFYLMFRKTPCLSRGI